MKYQDILFQISKDVIDLGVRGIYIVMTGIKNKDSDNGFEAYKELELKKLLIEYAAEEFIDNDSILAGFRELHSRVGRSNRRFVASPQFLVGRFQRTNQLPHVNLLVDIYNLVSLKSRLALGAHDIRKIDGNVSLKLTNGKEKFIPLGSNLPEEIFLGEYGYVDDSNEVICRMEVLQCEKTKIDKDSTDCFYIIQGNNSTSVDYLNSAAKELMDLTKKYCGGIAHSII